MSGGMGDAGASAGTNSTAQLRIVFTIITIVFAGCGTYRVTGPLPATTLAAFAPDVHLCVERPADWRSGDEVYGGSGFAVANRVVQALRSHFGHVQLVDAKDDAGAVDRCLAQHGRYLIIPHLMQWQQPAMNLSGFPSHVQVQLSLCDTRNQSFTRTVLFEGTQGYAAHFTDLVDEDLLAEQFNGAVLLLVGVTGPPTPTPMRPDTAP